MSNEVVINFQFKIPQDAIRQIADDIWLGKDVPEEIVRLFIECFKKEALKQRTVAGFKTTMASS